MKKVLTVLSVLFLSFALYACGPGTQPVDGSIAKLDTAHGNMSTLIADPSNIVASFQVPTSLAGGVTAAWESNNPGVISFGAPASGIANVTVNRPAVGQGDAVVTITATLSLKSELSDEILTKEWSIQLTVKENTVVEITIETIADILAIVDPAYDGVDYAVSIDNVTVFVNGGIPFGYDGTGIIQLFQAGSGIEAGKVYNIEGTLDWYYGIWEIKGAVGTEVTNATPQIPTKEVVTSVDALLAELVADGAHAYANVADGNFEPIYATVTGKIYMIPGDSGNYNTFILDSDTTTFVPGTASMPANGLMLYYQTNDLDYVRSFNGFEVSLDVVIYTYRSNNLAFAVFYVGGPNGIVAKLNDQQKVDLAKNSLTLPAEIYEEGKTLDLVTKGLNDVNVAWSFKDVNDPNNVLLNLTTGAVTLPASGTRQDVILVATITSGSVTEIKEITVKVGEIPLTSVADVKAATSNTLKFRISGTVIGYNGHRQISISDATGAITVYTSVEGAATLRLLIGKQVQIIGTRTVFSGLIQLTNTVVLDLEVDGVISASIDLRTIELWDAASLLPYQAGKVSVTNLKVTAVGTNDFGNVDLTLVDEVTLKTIKFFWDSRQPLVGSADFIKALVVGDYVSFENALLTWRSNNPVLAIDDALQVVEGESPVLTDDEELALDKALLDVATTVTSSFELPLTLANGTTVVWESSLPSVIASDGTFTQPAVDTVVTLTATLTNGIATDTKVFELTAKGPILPELFISEYIEGESGNNKAIELYNPTGAALDLSNYRLLQYNNGKTTVAEAYTLQLTGTLVAGGTFVVYNAQSAAEFITNAQTASLHAGYTFDQLNFVGFNGDDAIALEKLVGGNWVLIDLIGVIGIDPGSSWNVDGINTANAVLVRKPNVSLPNATWTPGEWTTFSTTYATNNLGTHTVSAA